MCVCVCVCVCVCGWVGVTGSEARQCFSNFKICLNPLEMLLRCRLRLGRSGVGPRSLRFCLSGGFRCSGSTCSYTE